MEKCKLYFLISLTAVVLCIAVYHNGYSSVIVPGRNSIIPSVTTPGVKLNQENPRVRLDQNNPNVIAPSVKLNQENPNVTAPGVKLNEEIPNVIAPSVKLNQENPNVTAPGVKLNKENPNVIAPSVKLNQEIPNVIAPSVKLNEENTNVIASSVKLIQESIIRSDSAHVTNVDAMFILRGVNKTLTTSITNVNGSVIFPGVKDTNHTSNQTVLALWKNINTTLILPAVKGSNESVGNTLAGLLMSGKATMILSSNGNDTLMANVKDIMYGNTKVPINPPTTAPTPKMIEPRVNGTWKERGFDFDPYSVILSIDEPYLCRNKDIHILMFVYSAAYNKVQRDTIRQTWGNTKQYSSGKNIVMLFVVGNDTKTSLSVLQSESQVNHDLIAFNNLTDSYKNLTYKGLASLKWIKNNCDNAQYIVKTDDDCMVNSFAARHELDQKEPFNFNSSSLPFLGCSFVKHNSPAMRDHGKWGVTKQQYVAESYPPYCLGTGFVMTSATVAEMYTASFFVQFLYIDDVFISGLLPYASLGKIIFRDIHYQHMTDGGPLKGVLESVEPVLTKFMFIHVSANKHLYVDTWLKYLQLNNVTASKT